MLILNSPNLSIYITDTINTSFCNTNTNTNTARRRRSMPNSNTNTNRWQRPILNTNTSRRQISIPILIPPDGRGQSSIPILLKSWSTFTHACVKLHWLQKISLMLIAGVCWISLQEEIQRQVKTYPNQFSVMFALMYYKKFGRDHFKYEIVSRVWQL